MSVNIEAILISLFSVKHTPEGAAHAAKEVMRQHAHELAEQQRAWDGPSLTMTGWTMVPLHMLADLIDPEVSG